MSLVKFIKQSKANVLAISEIMANDQGEGSQPWWDARVELLQGWFRANPLNLGVPSDGSSNFIKEQIERGNRYEKARVKVWRQIALELAEIPDFQKHITEEVRLSMQPAEDLQASIRKSAELGIKAGPVYLPPAEKQRTPRGSELDVLPLALGSHSRGPSPSLASTKYPLDDPERARMASRSPPGILPLARPTNDEARQYLTRRDDYEEEYEDDRRLDDEYYDEEAEEEEVEEGILIINGEGGGGQADRAASYIERQQLWLAQKQNRLHNQRREQEQALQTEMTFAPDIGNSQRTFKLKSQISPLAARRASAAPGASKEELEAMIAGAVAPRKTPETDGSTRRISVGEALSSKARRGSMDAKSEAPRRRRSSISQQKLAKLAAPGNKAEEKDGGGSSASKGGGRRGSITKKERRSLAGGDDGSGDEESKRRRSFSPGSRPSLADLPEGMRRSRSLTDFDNVLGGHEAERKEGGEEGDDGGDAKQASGDSAGNEESGAPEEGISAGASNNEANYRHAHPNSPYVFDVYSDDYVPGEFFALVSQGRGHVKIRNGADFQMRSMYRKKDKFQRVAGVSLLVGRHEKPPHDEKIITLMFDIENWTELQAWEWWKENKRRFIDDDYRQRCEKIGQVRGPVPAS